MGIKCPRCGSYDTRNSYGNKILKGVGEVTTAFVSSMISQKRSNIKENAIGRAVGGALGLLWHKRVCKNCGPSWWFEIAPEPYDD